jgi:hypothetical protein
MRNEDDLRAALHSLEQHAPSLAAVLPAAASGHQRPLARRRWLRIGGPVVAALIVVAAVVTPLAIGKITTTTPNGPAGPGSPSPSAAAVLSALATAAAAQPASAGKYLRASVFVGNLGVSGPNASPYIIDQRSMLSTTWYPVSPGAKVVAYASAEQTSMLPTPGAAAAWLADGKPALPHRAAQEALYPDFAGGDLGEPYFGGENLTAAQYQALPTSTAGLKAAVEHAAQTMHQALPGQHQLATNQEIFEVCLALLDHDPVSSAVRAATLRVLATLPGIQYEGTITDALGREGAAISMPGITAIPWGTGWGQSVPAGSDMTSYPRLRIVISSSGTLIDEEYVTTSPTLSGLSVLPSSGAIPGPTKCPAGYYSYDKGTACTEDGNIVHSSPGSFTITGPHGGRAPGKLVFLNQSVPAVPTGTVLAYRAFLTAGWTNDTPSASGSAQSIPTQSIPTQSIPGQ